MFTPVRLAWSDDAEWDAFVAGHSAGHFLQSSGWGRLRADQGWRVVRVGVRGPAGELLAGAQAQVRRTPLGSVAYVPRGPVCQPGDPAWPVLAQALSAALGRAAVAVRLEPHWEDVAATRAWLVGHGARAASPVQPPSTALLDLTPSEADLLAGFKQKWRYNVRLSERQGVTVRPGSASDLDAFGRLMAETATRDGFHARPAAYYRAVWAALVPHGRLYLAEWSGRPLAAILVLHFGPTATYLYGASSSDERQRMPNHLVQWAAIRDAKAAGLARYDFWGIPDEVGRAVSAGLAPDDVPAGTGDLWGVWGFKRGFGASVWRSVGAWDWVLAPHRYALGAWLRRSAGRGATEAP